MHVHLPDPDLTEEYIGVSVLETYRKAGLKMHTCEEKEALSLSTQPVSVKSSVNSSLPESSLAGSVALAKAHSLVAASAKALLSTSRPPASAIGLARFLPPDMESPDMARDARSSRLL